MQDQEALVSIFNKNREEEEEEDSKPTNYASISPEPSTRPREAKSNTIPLPTETHYLRVDKMRPQSERTSKTRVSPTPNPTDHYSTILTNNSPSRPLGPAEVPPIVALGTSLPFSLSHAFTQKKKKRNQLLGLTQGSFAQKGILPDLVCFIYANVSFQHSQRPLLIPHSSLPGRFPLDPLRIALIAPMHMLPSAWMSRPTML